MRIYAKKRVEGRKVAVFLLKIWSFHKKIVLLQSKWLQYYNLLMQILDYESSQFKEGA